MNIESQLLKKYNFLKNKDVEALLQLGTLKHFKTGDHFIHLGETRKKIGLIQKGLIRGYYINDKGEENTLLFAQENEIASAHELIFYKEASRQIVEILEPSEIWVFNFDDIEKLSDVNPAIRELKNQFFQQFLVKILRRLDSFLTKKPEERYLWFINEHPGLMQRVQQKHFASFLGITPVSLSRIRSRLGKSIK